MGLMSPSLLWLLGIVTLGLPVAAVVLWRRIPGPAPWPTLGRLGLVVTSQLAAVLLAAAAVNDYGYFYGSWNELSGALSRSIGGMASPRLSVHDLVTVHGGPHPGASVPLAAAGLVTAHTYPGFSSPSQWPVRGHLETVRIRGPVSQLSSTAFVYLPPQYYQARYAHKRFPAVLALTGYPGNDRNLIARMKYQDAMLRDIRRHQARPMVVVMTRSAVVFPRDTECTDVPGGPQVATFFTQDVTAEISHRYRVPPTGWGVIGDSTGGYCAAKLSMQSPSTFPASVSISGYYHTLQDSTTGNLWGRSGLLRDLNSPEWRLAHMPAPPVSMLVTSSRGELGPLGLPDMLRFLHLVQPPMRVTSYVAAHGGHTFTTWAPQLPMALQWLSAHLPKNPGTP